jgi:hypothetical protein
MGVIKETFDTTQDVIWFLQQLFQQLLRGEAMPFPSVDFIKMKGFEGRGLVWTVKVD